MGIFQKYSRSIMAFSIALMSVSLVACNDSNSSGSTETPPPTTTLEVTSTGPVNGAVDVGKNLAVVTATFNEVMNVATLDTTSFTVISAVGTMTGNVTLDNATNKTAIFEHSGGGFAGDTTYTATITTEVKSEDGKTLASNYEWSFTTGDEDDLEAPTVTSTDPADSATGIAVNRNITASFSETMNAATINSSTFTVMDNNTDPVTGTVEIIGTTAVFNPASDLETGTEYEATLSTGVEDLARNALAADKIWKFTTGDSVAQGPDPVVLGTAGDYVILAKSGISTTGTTKITGDIAVSPIDLTAITGFDETLSTDGTSATSLLVTGDIFAANLASPTPSILTTAISDMETAYTNAAGRSDPDFTELYAGDISNKTLAPGLYKWGTNVSINTTVTLSGSANDVWVFQIAGDVIQASDTQVLLDGAVAKNVFWQVGGGTGVVIGTDATFEGVVLAEKAVSVKTGATVNGRLLSQTAVTLDANAVTEPTE